MAAATEDGKIRNRDERLGQYSQFTKEGVEMYGLEYCRRKTLEHLEFGLLQVREAERKSRRDEIARLKDLRF